MTALRNGRLAVLVATYGILLPSLYSAARASDAKIGEDPPLVDRVTFGAIQDAGLKTIYQSLVNPNRFYYLPSSIRFWKDRNNEPAWTVVKYSFAYSGEQILDEKA